MSHPSILILGGGLGGLACAVALRQRGFESIVCEQAPRFDEVGAGLLLSPNAYAVVRALGLLPALEARAVATPVWEILDKRGCPLTRFDPCRGGGVALSTRRSDLQDVLRAALPADSIRTAHEGVSIEKEDGHVDVHFRNSTTLRTDLLIVADGSNSISRAQLSPTRKLNYSGYVGWRAVIRGVPAAWSPHRVTESWGRGQRFGIAPTGDGRCYWYATTNEAEGETRPHQRQARLLKAFCDWHEPVSELIAGTLESEILRHPIRDTLPGGAWQMEGRIALLGDAAHALTPNLGQGCAMALEDAWSLADCLEHARHPATALREYENLRRWRLLAVWAASRAVGAMIQWENRALCSLRDLVLRLTPDALSNAGLRALWGFQAPRLLLR